MQQRLFCIIFYLLLLFNALNLFLITKIISSLRCILLGLTIVSFFCFPVVQIFRHWSWPFFCVSIFPPQDKLILMTLSLILVLVSEIRCHGSHYSPTFPFECLMCLVIQHGQNRNLNFFFSEIYFSPSFETGKKGEGHNCQINEEGMQLLGCNKN